MNDPLDPPLIPLPVAAAPSMRVVAPVLDERDSTPPGSPWWVALVKWSAGHTSDLGKLIVVVIKLLVVLALAGVFGLSIWALWTGYLAWRAESTSQNAAVVKRLDGVEGGIGGIRDELRGLRVDQREQAKELLEQLRRKGGR